MRPTLPGLLDEAEALFTDLVSRRPDPALANAAQLGLGDVLCARAALLLPATPAAGADARPALLDRALAAFRAVEGKAAVIAAQTARIERVKEAVRGAAADRAEFQRWQGVLRRETTKLGQLQAREDDPALTARLRCAPVLYQLGKYDETRVLLAALAPLVTQPADRKTVLLYRTLALAAQGLAGPAAAGYAEFQASHAGDPLGEGLPLALGAMFLGTVQPPDPAQAEKYFADFARLYPDSRLRDVARVEAATRDGAPGPVRRGVADAGRSFENAAPPPPPWRARRSWPGRGS